MKQLVLRNATYEKIYRVTGIVFLVGLIVIVVTGDPKSWSFWIQAVSFLLLGIIFLSLNFGTLVNRLSADKGVLTIRWYSKTVRSFVRIDEIESIHAEESYIRIMLKSGKTVRLPTRMLEFDEKRAVRKFLKEVTGF